MSYDTGIFRQVVYGRDFFQFDVDVLSLVRCANLQVFGCYLCFEQTLIVLVHFVYNLWD